MVCSTVNIYTLMIFWIEQRVSEVIIECLAIICYLYLCSHGIKVKVCIYGSALSNLLSSRSLVEPSTEFISFRYRDICLSIGIRQGRTAIDNL